jgi:predicted dehydrogenase
MIRIGLAGIGFMGRIHFLGAKSLQGAKIAAVCSRDQAKLNGDWTKTRGNFGPEPGHVDLTGIAKYASYQEMLADKTIDMIDICTPTDQHPEMAIAALQAGKHVLVEKAIAMTPVQADQMLAASQEAGKLLMVAHVLPFFPEFAYAAEAVRSQKFGKLLGAHFTRVISKPDWSADIGDASKTGGPAVDLHIHDTHFIGLIAGVPKKVFSTGVIENDTVTYLTTQYLYGPDGPSVTCSSGAVAMKGRPFVHGFEIYLEKATLALNASGFTVFGHDGTVSTPQLTGGGDPISAFKTELQTAVDGVVKGQVPDLLSSKLARDALVMCLKECESVKTGQAILMT